VVLTVFSCVLLYVAYRATSAEERARAARAVLEAIREARRAAARRAQKEPFGEALRARTPRAPVTPALVALNAVIFLLMLAGAGSLGHPDTFVRWGGNFGPRTTNGEWWRLVATAFIHSGMLPLLINIAGMFQLGLVVERLVGPVALAVTYAAAALCASLVSLSLHPVTVNAGASAAIFGIYGLLLASSIWSIRHRSTVTIPLLTLKRIAPAAAVFMLYNLGAARSERPLQLAGLLTGVALGAMLTKNIGERKPPVRLVAAAALAIAVAAVTCAVPLRGMAYVKPEIERLASLEDRTVSAYQAEVERFKNGRVNAVRLAGVIDRAITPEVQAARARLTTLKHVPRDERALVDAAEEYLRLRDESWRLRSEALHKSSMPALRKADKSERASLEAFQRMLALQ
jgi:rhomboid protease GluP